MISIENLKILLLKIYQNIIHFRKTFVLSIICSKYNNEGEKVFTEE